MKYRYSAIAIALPFLSFMNPALAYVGPGAGITMLGALWAIVLAIIFSIGAILFFPIRAMLKKRSHQKHAQEEEKTKN